MMVKDPSIFTADHGFVEERELNGGKQWLFRYQNGYGASVVRHSFSYGRFTNDFELAVIRWKKDGFALEYSTPITSNVLGGLTPLEVAATLKRIAAL